MSQTNSTSLVHLICVIFMVFALTSEAKKNQNRNLLEDVAEFKDFKKILRTRKNVIALFASSEPVIQSWVNIYSDAAAEMKGLATFVFVDCEAAKKMCKKLKASPQPALMKHYQDGEFNRDYDRKATLRSLLNFMRDPTGDVPWEEEPAAKDIVHIDSSKELNKLLSTEKGPILTMFYAPWCGHCKKLKPDFAEAATELKGSAVLAGMDVDRPGAQSTRQVFNITGFPTIIYFENGKKKYDFGGERSKSGIIDWMNDPSPPKEPEQEVEWSDEESEVIHLSDETFDSYLAEHSSVLVMFYAPWCGHCKKMKPEYADAAAQLAESGHPGVLAAIDVTKDKEVGGKFEIKGFPTVKYFKDGEFAWDLNERTADKIVEHMQDPQEPPPPPPPEPAWSEQESEVVHLTAENFKSFTKKKKHTLVMFYAPWCGHCKKAKPEFQGAAEQMKDELKVAYAAMDCTEQENKDVCSTFGVSGYPTLKYFNYGKNPEDYRKGREEKDFVTFMKQQLDPNYVDDTPPPPPEEDFWLTLDGGENVHQLTSSNFDEVVAEKESALVMFYAPWCGHCKKIKPAFSEAATRAKEMELNGIFAAVDATRERSVAEKYDVKGFPTIKLFKNGQIEADYAGDRSTEDMLQFLQGSTENLEPSLTSRQDGEL